MTAPSAMAAPVSAWTASASTTTSAKASTATTRTSAPTTSATPQDGSCSNDPVDDGTDCDGGNGMCVSGECMAKDLCEGVECEDTGNDCTTAACNNQTGECDVMDEPDGTECNDGAGACSAGECVDNNLCDGVDCSSANDCVQDGTCDPADGECIAGDNEPADTPCDGDTGVCDGAGSCVDCNSAGQCPAGDQCNVATCTDNTCGTEQVMDGTVCDFQGTEDGICEGGNCVEAPECISPGDCDDSNPCTLETCDSGTCVYEPLNGGSCDADGLPGMCDNGGCVGLCEGVDCASDDECVQDGVCDTSDGTCIPGDPVDAGEACSGGVCDGAGSCVECVSDNDCNAGQTCTDNECVAGGVDPDPQSKVITVSCGNNVTADVSILPYLLEVDPGLISAGSGFNADLSGVAEFSEAFLDAAQGAVPGGVRSAALVDLKATVQVRGDGATGDNVVMTAGANIPFTCGLAPTPCDPANNTASVPGQIPNTDCVPTGFFNPCNQVVDVPISEDCAAGGICDSLGKAAQCTSNNFCVTGGLPIDLDATSGMYIAGASGSTALFGWYDDPAAASPGVGTPAIEGDGTWNMLQPQFTGTAGPIGLAVNAGGLSVQLECVMGVDSGGPGGVGVSDDGSPTPDDALISFDIP